MARTTSYTIDAINPFESVTVISDYCTSVTVREANMAATLDWKAKGLSTDTPISIPAGVPHEFKATPGTQFVAGQVVGYIATVSGSMNVDQFEN